MAYEVADRIYRLGADLVNWWFIEDGGRVTVVDTGTPRQYLQLPKALARLDKTPADVEAILLTHAHGDHIGSAELIRRDSGAIVHVHRQDVGLARGDASRQAERGFVRDLTNGFAWRAAWFLMRSGLSKAVPVQVLTEFDHGDVLDIPGHPRVIHTPGHTDGSCCLDIEDRRALLTGDALVTLSLATGERTPRIMPGSFNKNSIEALESLNELAGSRAELILPGHGEPWRGPVGAAIALAHRTGVN